ncbi:HPr kinase/phosphorylase [Rhizobium sp.]|jgi:serine kinase of HPr protein (carbohydrate metabolism regulator)|uniref:HPr kinase/phosphorylase n=1 Tax=Rhizobium sp. TaxID=391 RepID=UPI000E9E4D46|nr:serine kinase [Rhizobium sp.]
MINSRTNLHATGVVLGRQGFLILGPSGCGKSQLARLLLHDAARNGMFCALISDDQVWIEAQGDTLMAHRAKTIKDMMEVRFSGIVHIPSIGSAVIDAVIMPVALCDVPERLPQSDETMDFFSTITLPVLRICVAHNPDITLVQNLLTNSLLYQKNGQQNP